MKLDNIHGIVITVIDYIPIIEFHITISIVESPLSFFSFFLINYPPLILIITSYSLNGYFFSLSLSLVLPSLFARLKSRESGDLGKNFYFRELWLRNYVNRGTSHYGMTDIWKNRGESGVFLRRFKSNAWMRFHEFAKDSVESRKGLLPCYSRCYATHFVPAKKGEYEASDKCFSRKKRFFEHGG